MSGHKENKINIPKEQLERLAASFFPVIKDFYRSDRGKKFWKKYLKENGQKADTAAV